MAKAIKRAIEGGYDCPGYIAKRLHSQDDDKELFRLNIYAISTFVLDPLFWQALGKVEGWDSDYFYNQAYSQDMSLFGSDESWKMNWHRFIDHLIEGKSADDFFNTLLK